MNEPEKDDLRVTVCRIWDDGTVHEDISLRAFLLPWTGEGEHDHVPAMAQELRDGRPRHFEPPNSGPGGYLLHRTDVTCMICGKEAP
jgi:hypothetical protein